VRQTSIPEVAADSDMERQVAHEDLKSGSGRPVVLHIGLHKTATTFLQLNVWPAIYGMGGWKRPKVEKFLREIGSARLPAMVSQENLSGVLAPRRPGESWDRFQSTMDAAVRRDPPPEILMVVRPHADWLRSAYLDRLKRGYRGTARDYVAKFSSKDLSWHRRAVYLADRFPKVTVLSYDELVRSPERFLGKVLECLNVRDGLDVRELLANARRPTNVSPKTYTAMAVGRMVYRPGVARFLSRVSRTNCRLRGGCPNCANHEHDILEHVVGLANRIPFSRTINVDMSFLGDRFDEDWQQVMRHLAP